jgi:rubrerythrin
VKQVYLAQDPIEANVLVDLLKDEYERARTLALEFDRQQRTGDDEEPLEPWICPSCGETIEGQFDQCWHCGEERP